MSGRSVGWIPEGSEIIGPLIGNIPTRASTNSYPYHSLKAYEPGYGHHPQAGGQNVGPRSVGQSHAMVGQSITRAQWVAYYLHGVPLPAGPAGPPAATPQGQADLLARGISAIQQAQNAQQGDLLARGISALRQGGY